MNYFHIIIILLGFFPLVNTNSQSISEFSEINLVETLSPVLNTDQLKTVTIDNLPFIKQSENNTNLFVVVFIGTDCPISQKYVHTLREMSRQYAKDITLYGIVPNNFSEKQIENFNTEYKIPFKIIKDNNNKFAREFNATTTPESFLFDNNGIIYYDGAIDNWFFALGRNKLKPTINYLENAITDVLNNRPVKNTHADAVGCFIELKK